MKTEIIYNDENQNETSELIPAARSFFEAESFVTCQKSLSGEMTIHNLWKRKCDMQLSLGPFNPLLPISNILEESGNEIAMMNDFLECLLPE